MIAAAATLNESDPFGFGKLSLHCRYFSRAIWLRSAACVTYVRLWCVLYILLLKHFVRECVLSQPRESFNHDHFSNYNDSCAFCTMYVDLFLVQVCCSIWKPLPLTSNQLMYWCTCMYLFFFTPWMLCSSYIAICMCSFQLKSKQDTYFAVELSEDPDEFRLGYCGLCICLLFAKIAHDTL